MKALITGIDSLSKRILVDLDRGIKVLEIPEIYPVSLDQAKRLSRYLKILQQAEDNLHVDAYEMVKTIGLKILPLAKLFKQNDWEGLTEILSAVTDETTRDELELMIKGLEEKRERIREFKASVGDEIELLQEEELRLNTELLSSDIREVKAIKRGLQKIQEKIKFLRQTAPQQYMERFEPPLRLSLDELKQHKELQDLAVKWLYRQGYIVASDLTLPNNRQGDVFGYNESGHIVIIEVKVSAAELFQDKKWREYLNYCDEFYFLVPTDLLVVLDDMDKNCGQLIGTSKGVQVKREDLLVHGLESGREDLIFFAGRVLAKKIVYGY